MFLSGIGSPGERAANAERSEMPSCCAHAFRRLAFLDAPADSPLASRHCGDVLAYMAAASDAFCMGSDVDESQVARILRGNGG